MNTGIAITLIIVVLLAFYVRARCCEDFDGKPVVTFHYTTWCYYCKQFKPVWEALKKSVSHVHFAEVDEDKTPTPGIESYPTIILRNGTEVYRYEGKKDFEPVRKWILSR